MRSAGGVPERLFDRSPTLLCRWNSRDGPLSLLLDFDAMAFDLLIQGGERNLKVIRSLGLAPAGLFKHFNDHAALEGVDDFKQRRIFASSKRGQRREL